MVVEHVYQHIAGAQEAHGGKTEWLSGKVPTRTIWNVVSTDRSSTMVGC